MRIAALALAAAAAGLFAYGDAYAMRLGMLLAMNIALASGWNIIGGMAGYPSFATGAFFGLGAYAGALAQGAGVPMPLSWAFASLVAALLALVVGLLVLRLRGHYFAIASLAVVIVLRQAATNWTDLTGGGMGLNLPVLQTGVVAQARLCFSLRCIRQNETAAGVLGLNAGLVKSAAFALSAAIAGPAGAIYASSVFYIEPSDVFDIVRGVEPIIMVMLGGIGTVAGPVLGAIAFVTLEQTVWAQLVSAHQAVLGVLVVALALFLPKGIVGGLLGRFP